jgi:predicted DsbA family dithiol-disulfide isomerase
MVIEIVSDVVCPWCFIGKRRLERAVKLLQLEDVQLRWRAFDLNPGTPKEGVRWQEHMIRKFGSADYAQRLEAHVAAEGAKDGIALRFDRIERLPNTLDAHRLSWLAGQQGKQAAVVERLFEAYFTDGQDIGSPEVLTRIGKEAGIDVDSVADLWASDSGVAEVLAEQNDSRLQGVGGVPAFFLNGVPIASGAQKPELLASLIDSAAGRCSLKV